MGTISEVKEFIREKKIPLEFSRGNHQWRKITHRVGNFTIWDIDSKKKPYYFISDEDWEKEWSKCEVARVQELPEKWKEKMLEFQIRTEIDHKKCPFLIGCFDQGVWTNNGKIYYATRYEDPCRDYDKFINVDCKGIKHYFLDVYRVLRGGLEVFEYLEDNKLELRQFNEKNTYYGSMTEDRGWPFRTMFKGHKKGAKDWKLSAQPRHRFSSPKEDGDRDLYKSYTFTLALLAIWGVYVTNEEPWPEDLNITDEGVLKGLVDRTVELLNSRDENPELKDLLKYLLYDLLIVDIERRPKAKDLLKYKFFIQAHIKDSEEYQREIEESNRVNEKYKEQMS